MVFPDAHGDWRWRSWRWLAGRAGAWAATLGDLPPGSRVGYPWRPTPDAIAADLGIQAAGGLAVPALEGDEAALPPLARWLAVAGEGAPVPLGTSAVTLPGADAPVGAEVARARPGWGPGDAGEGLLAADPPRPGGGALVRRDAVWEAWDRDALAAGAAAFAVPDRGHHRPIALVAGDLAAAAERAWLAWALAAGAALVLPGDSAFAAWAIFWPRPTDVLLAADELPAVRSLLATLGRPRAQRRRLARLRRLLVHGGEPDAAERAAWAALGVTVATAPELPRPSPRPAPLAG